MTYQKIRLIFNPFANLGRVQPIASSLHPIVEKYSNVEWVETGAPGHAAELAKQAGLQGCDLVIAAGGDGTVHEVANGLMHLPAAQRPALGIIPTGSGNDFAFSSGIPVAPQEALRTAIAGHPHPVDVGRIEDDCGRAEFFTNAVGIGFDAIVVIHSRNVPMLQGFGIYLVAVMRTLIFNHHPFLLKLEMDGKSTRQSLLMLAICNGQREGGGFHLVPDGKNDDGWLDTVALQRVSRTKLLLQTLVPFLKGTHTRLAHVHMDQARTISLESDIPLIIHTDGEIFAGFDADVRRLKLEILPGALHVSK